MPWHAISNPPPNTETIMAIDVMRIRKARHLSVARWVMQGARLPSSR